MAQKVYVKVNADFSEEGELRPKTITWVDGRIYEIVRILHKVRAASTKVGGRGIRYTVVIDGKEWFLFREEERWFVEVRT